MPRQIIDEKGAVISEEPENDGLDYYDDEPGDDLDEDEDYLINECGMMANGQCTKAGSEECDWVCPRGRM